MREYLNKLIKKEEEMLDTIYSGNISKMFHAIEAKPPLIALGKKAQWQKLVRGACIEYEQIKRNKQEKKRS